MFIDFTYSKVHHHLSDPGSMSVSVAAFLANTVVEFRNGEANMGCFHRAVRVVVAVPALVAISVLALAEVVARLALGIVITVLGLLLHCCLGYDKPSDVGVCLLASSIVGLDVSPRSIACIFANIFTCCRDDHSFDLADVQFPCALDLSINAPMTNQQKHS